MRRPTARRGLLLLGFLLALGCACAVETPCDDGVDNDANTFVDCDDPACDGDPACTETPEDCENGLDDDGDDDVDGDDRDCEPETAPLDPADCTGQDSINEAGDDTDVTTEPDGCEEPTDASSAEGGSAHLEFTEDGSGVIQAALSFAADDANAQPNVTTDFTVEFPYEAGGSHVWLSAFAMPTGPVTWQATGSCASEGYTIPITAPRRIWVPTDTGGGTIPCSFHLDAALIGSGSGALTFFVGGTVAADTDGDGRSNRNDLCNGCPNEGTFGPGGIYRYACRDAAEPCAIGPDPNPEFCSDCLMQFGDVVADVGPEGSLLFGGDSILVADDAVLESDNGTIDDADDWRVEGSEIEYFPEGRFLRCSSCIELDRFCSDCGGIASIAALDGGAGAAAVITVETDDPDVEGQFDLDIQIDQAPHHMVTFATNGGSAGEFHVVFDESATVEALAADGFAAPTDDCPGDAPLATFTGSATCRFTYAALDLGDVVAVAEDGVETFSELPDVFGPGPGARFAINADNGIGVHDKSTSSLVPSLSEVNFPPGFSNVLGSLFFDAPAGANDTVFLWQQGSGSLTTGWFEELGGYGARQFGFGAYYGGAHRDGDPNSQEGIVVTSGGVQRLFFQDFGGGTILLNSATYVPSSALPTGYTPRAAFWTNDSPEVLIAAQSTTPGANGRVFRASPTTGFGAAIPVGDIDPGARSMDCDHVGSDAKWYCVVTCSDGDPALLSWQPAVDGRIVQKIAAGPSPLGIWIGDDGNDLHVAITNYGDATLTTGTIDGETGAIASETQPLPSGVVQPSSVIELSPGLLAVLARDEEDPQQGVVVRVGMGW